MTNSELLCAETETKLLFPHAPHNIIRGCAAHKRSILCLGMLIHAANRKPVLVYLFAHIESGKGMQNLLHFSLYSRFYRIVSLQICSKHKQCLATSDKHFCYNFHIPLYIVYQTKSQFFHKKLQKRFFEKCH